MTTIKTGRPSATPGVMALYQQGRVEQAWQLGRRALAEHPSDVDLLNLLGVIGWQLRQYQAAHGYLVKSLSLQPRQAGAYVNLGLVLQAVGRRGDALACYDRALALVDLPPARLNKAACLITMYRYREALDVLQSLLDRPDVDPQAALNAAVACRELDRLDDALTWYERVVQHQPNSADALRQYGECLARAGRIDEGISQVERALAIAPQSAMVWLALARIRSSNREHALALEAFEKATECGPDIVDAWIGLARELQRRGEYAKALEMANRAVAMGASDAAAWFCRASIRMDLRQFVAPEIFITS
ncbi:MAG: tetratricopeptide repeat protein [Pseudomonadota bacterium]